jgi:hypothetical protein
MLRDFLANISIHKPEISSIERNDRKGQPESLRGRDSHALLSPLKLAYAIDASPFLDPPPFAAPNRQLEIEVCR